MDLTHTELEEFKNALLDAYGSRSQLEQMLFYKLSLQLNTIAGGDDLEEIIFQLFMKAKAQGWMKQLVIAAYDYNSGNELLMKFYQKHKSQLTSNEGRNTEDEHNTFRIDKIFQLISPYKSIVEQISHEHGMDDFEATSAEEKLRVYKHTLEKIFAILGEDLQALSEVHLEDIKVGLREIINGFYYLRTQPMDINIDFMQIFLQLREANANLLTATTRLEGGKGKDVEYYLALQICREKIFETSYSMLSKS